MQHIHPHTHYWDNLKALSLLCAIFYYCIYLPFLWLATAFIFFSCVCSSIQWSLLWLLLSDSLIHLPFWSEASIIASLNCHYSLLPLNTSSVSWLPALCIVEHSDRLMSTRCLSPLRLVRLLSPRCYRDLCWPVNMWCLPYLRRLAGLFRSSVCVCVCVFNE